MILLLILAALAGWLLAGFMIRRQERKDYDEFGIVTYEPSWRKNYPRTEAEAWERFDQDEAIQWERESR